MPKISKETLEKIIREVHGLDIPDERLGRITRAVNQTLEALEKSSQVELEGLEPSPSEEE